ncbi:MAG: hypothetical protein B9S36_04790 [Verrucomicrobiia bacterium Tous-C2TDCM]|nr:MAG: hypothetical protein B9S36_04790 [Verrucomicrobiae bacterium Tous-C2TDCM]
MKRFTCYLAICLAAVQAQAQKIEFNRDIRPILSDKCFACHGPDAKNAKSEYRLDTFDHATTAVDGVTGIVPGKLKDSEVHWRIHSDDASEVMPPPESKRSLNPAEIALLDRWIEQGAEYQKHWSFVPVPAEVPVPKVASDWVKNGIDAFVLTKLQEKGFSPSPETSREKWLRRVTFDLTGLPPTPTELDAFLADSNPDAYEKVVDRLLASEASAERLTAEWLDVARYSDSYGFQVDGDRFVWPWRDWVIRAFRENLPYDDFITWQLAGDLLPDATRDQKLATAFNRLHPQNVEGGSVPEEFRVEYVADRVHTYGTAFLGLTMECSRCHDHKYDPITAKDYYSLSAFFANIDEAGLYSYFTPAVPTPTLWLPDPKQEEELARISAEVAALEKDLASRITSAKSDYETWLAAQTTPATLPAPIAAHDFDELVGGGFPNLVAKGAAAKTNANNVLVAGRRGQAVKLTGDDAVTLGVGNFSRSDPFSVSLWMQTPDRKARAVVLSRSKAWTDAASRGYELLIEKGKLNAALVHYEPGNALRVQTKNEFPVGSWHHVALTYDGSSRAAGLRLYVDGEEAPIEIVRDKLTREITGGGSDTIVIGERMRDSGFKNGLVDDFRVYDRNLSGAAVKSLASDAATFTPDPHYFLTEHDAASRELRGRLLEKRKEQSALVEKIPEIMVMAELEGKARETHLLERGSYLTPAEVVAPATPAFLPSMPADAPKDRLGLAQWTVSAENPLPARVTVNRYWQRLFLNGLVATAEDFGSQGRLPTHPELLDWLARDFVNHGWDLRHLLKTIVLSATYRQSSNVASGELATIDPENTLLYRYPAPRLTAEMLRDNALAVSGLLVNQVGGPSVKPYDIEFAFKPSSPDKGPGLYRRSVYTYMRQTAPSPLMTTLNASKRDVCQVKIERTDSPLQGLVMLNAPQFAEAARVLAAKLVAQHGDDDAALVKDAFRRLTSRLPDDEERMVLSSLLAEQQTHFESRPGDAKALLAAGGSAPSQTTQPARVAAAATLVSTLLNFDESLSKR